MGAITPAAPLATLLLLSTVLKAQLCSAVAGILSVFLTNQLIKNKPLAKGLEPLPLPEFLNPPWHFD